MYLDIYGTRLDLTRTEQNLLSCYFTQHPSVTYPSHYAAPLVSSPRSSSPIIPNSSPLGTSSL